VSERATPTRTPGWWTLARDVGSFLGGWAVVFLELQRPEIRESVLVFAAGVVGLPTAFVGVQSVADAILGRRNGTEGPSSQSPEPAASQSQ
jgi:hypothetical protein